MDFFFSWAKAQVHLTIGPGFGLFAGLFTVASMAPRKPFAWASFHQDPDCSSEWVIARRTDTSMATLGDIKGGQRECFPLYAFRRLYG